MSKSNQPGFMFTFVWGFDLAGDWEFVEQLSHTFASKGHEVIFVELEAGLEERLVRNKSPHRLQHKASKRNVERSEQDLLRTMETHRLNSFPGEIKRETYIRIETTNSTPAETAQLIKQRFHL
ncbi:hypothetical protein [Paenibacillus koleovorans]|uniref:hypothetical protein n=1 Tax=Paenibacillus koleovorans TaxID=121608 RepID=UPI001FEC8C93|nr:hypothetical protein [Paenibacillus koleovorans]